ncbi:MAG: hypothetical protein NTW10_06355 [Bacteroidetes bacterium]|nr:hypothetical protein [Bacteroidota bacterium]
MRIFKTLIIVFCVVSIAGCKKPVFDYRKKYLGDYSFSVYQARDIGPGHYDTTYSTDGTISKGSDLQSIMITYTSHKTVELILYEDGSLQVKNCSYSCKGAFESVNKMMYTIYWDGLSGESTESVTGTKK